MDKYKKLMLNTVIFGISTFSSKVLVFLLMPLYTRVLTKADYGTVDLLVQTGNLLLPLISMGIVNAVLRFGLDSTYRKSDVFSTGLKTILIGFLILLCCSPLLGKIEFFTGYTMLICVFVLMSSLRSLCSQFTRAKGYIRLVAFDGILSTAMTIFFNVLYLVWLKLGISGYILAMVTADFLSACFLFFSARLHRYLKWKGISWETALSMLKYSIPLIPTTMLWWVTNVSDRYLVSWMIGTEANGLYTVSYKIPTVVILVSSIFMEAWQISAVTEGEGRKAFFTKVFGAFQSVIFSAAAGLILFARPITQILVSEAFYPSWQYIPFLVMSTTYSCLVTFMGSIYMVEKKSVMSMLTTLAGAAANVGLNLWWIPIYGVNGAAFATFVSYLLVFILRALNARRYIPMQWRTGHLALNTSILMAQSFILILEAPYWVAWEIGLTALMILLNIGNIWVTVKKILKKG